ncbi:hypothetical protein GEMRC1_012150 [Eukaryota sp. GEM-RC1]
MAPFQCFGVVRVYLNQCRMHFNLRVDWPFRSYLLYAGEREISSLPSPIGKSGVSCRTLPTSPALHQQRHLNSAEHGSAVGKVLESEMANSGSVPCGGRFVENQKNLIKIIGFSDRNPRGLAPIKMGKRSESNQGTKTETNPDQTGNPIKSGSTGGNQALGGKSSRKVSCPDFECDCDCDCDCQSKSNQIFSNISNSNFSSQNFQISNFSDQIFSDQNIPKSNFLPEPTFSPVTEGPLLSRDPTYTLDSQSNLSESLAESGVHGPDSVSVAKEHRGEEALCQIPVGPETDSHWSVTSNSRKPVNDNEQFRCFVPRCGKVLRDRQALTRHIAGHNLSEDVLLQNKFIYCTCGSLVAQHSLRMHQLKKGCKTSSVDRLTCFVGSCRRKFNQRRNFTRHLSLCHKTVSDDLLATHDFCRCRCNNIFSSDGLALHLRRCKAPVAKSESPTVEPTTEPPLDESPLFDLPSPSPSTSVSSVVDVSESPLKSPSVQGVSPTPKDSSEHLVTSSPLPENNSSVISPVDSASESSPCGSQSSCSSSSSSSSSSFPFFPSPSLPSSSSSIPLRPSPPTGPEQLSLRQSSLDIFTDGSYSSVTKTAGFGVFYSYDDKESRIYGPSASTHNCAEFEAVVVALQSLKSLDSPRRVTVFSDSSLVVDALNLKARLREKRLAVFYNRIFALLEDELLKPFSISFKKIQAHNHNAGNDEADRLAKLGASGLSSTDADLNTVSDRPQDNPVAPEVAPEFDLPAPDSVLTDNSQKCFLCPLTFARTRSLCTHIDRCHPEVDQDTLLAHGLCRCPACPKVFSTRGFDNHWKTHSSGEQQSFIPELSPDTLVSLLTSFASLPYRRLGSQRILELCCLLHLYFLPVLRTEVSLSYDLACCLFEAEQRLLHDQFT